ncbi:MAG TPA: peptidoglycan DD-metalloendopeptidase family protein [Caulobacteraceae bacterium]|nr:peptidoglycan DD-metalloendopeptidase family protein [Caulobacteraceae bacterium]
MRRLAAIAAALALPLTGAAQEPASAPQPRPTQGAAAREEIEALRAELARITASGPRNTAEVAAAKARLQAFNVRESALSVRLGADRNRLARLLSALQLFRRRPPPALLVSPDDARNAVRAAILIRAMTPELERRAAALSDEARAMAALRREAAAASGEIFTTESTIAEQRADIERLLAGAEGDQLFARSPGAMVATLAPSAPGGTLNRLAAPVSGPIVRGFGAETPAGGRAPGVTFASQGREAVRAPAEGTVEFAAPVTGWGVVLILRSGGSHHIVLGGLAEATVAPGQSVASGAPIGRMADGGRSGGELYLEVREGGSPVDPTQWLGGASQRTAVR